MKILSFDLRLFKVRFNINQWLRDREQRNQDLTKRLCPHATLEFKENDKSAAIASLYAPRPGRQSWQCIRCKEIVDGEGIVQRQAEYWAQRPMELQARERQFQKHTKKLGYG